MILAMSGKNLIIINAHSFIDVITNSSSELFVLDTTKSVDAVKEVLQEMLKYWNEMAAKGFFGDHYIKNERYALGDTKMEPEPIKTWDGTFGNVYIYTKELYEADAASLEKYRKEYKRKDSDFEPGWGYEKKENIGKIFIESESDNSIPHEMFDWIESAFGYRTNRYHLG